MDTMTIGQVATQAGVGVETIRFYQREGLLEAPQRPREGYRRYPQDSVQRILFIRGAKDLGFSLHEIRELLALRAPHAGTCSVVKGRVEAKVAAIDSKIRELQHMRQTLVSMVRGCAGGEQCAVIEALASPADTQR